jgi:hypothetical protein
VAQPYHSITSPSTRAISFDMNFGCAQFASLCFRSLNTILYPRVSFLSPSCCPAIEGKGPRYCNSGFGLYLRQESDKRIKPANSDIMQL